MPRAASRTRSGLVLFADLVAYSTFPDHRQAALIAGLNAAVREALDLPARTPLPKSIRALPTGDGVALVWLGDDRDDARTLLRVALAIQAWAGQAALPEDRQDVAVRLGIDIGPLQLIADVNLRRNVCGATINAAARVMSQAGAAATLASKAFLDRYFGRGDVEVEYRRVPYRLRAGTLRTFEVKHHLPLVAGYVQLEQPSAVPWWRNLPPARQVRKVYFCMPGDAVTLHAPLIEALGRVVQAAGAEVVLPAAHTGSPAEFQDVLMTADAVLVLALPYAERSRAEGAKTPASSWLHAALGAAVAGVGRTIPAYVVAHEAVETHGLMGMAAVRCHLPYVPGDAARLARIGAKVAAFLERAKAADA